VSYATWIPGGGIASADSLCQSEATTAKLPRHVQGPAGADRLDRSVEVLLRRGQPALDSFYGILVAPTASAFFTTALFDASPNISADGSTYYGFSGVWTGAANL